MQELIDKEQAYTALKHEQYTHGVSCSAKAFEKAARIIDQMPSIKSEVRRGRWVAQEDADGDISFVCSECGRRLRRDEDFCPSCGSDMRTVDTKD